MSEAQRLDQTASTEIELKLAAEPADLDKLKDALLAMPAVGTDVRSLLSTYYDTPNLALRRAGLTLRVRRQGKKFVQTVKADDADVLSRGEWEDPVKRNRPDLDAPNSGKRLPRSARNKALRPLFTTAVTRTVIEIEPRAGTRIEAAVDAGEIRAAKGSAAEQISEIELELKSGDAAALYDVALQLLDVAAIRIDTRSKSERGYRLLKAAGIAPEPVHAVALTLDPDMTAEAALEGIGRRCLAQLLRNEPVVLAGEPEGVHQMRVAVRRLRAALSAFKPMLPDDDYRWLTDELKSLTERLGPARNWEVFVTELLPPPGDASPDKRALKDLREAAEQRRRATMDEAKEALFSRSHVQAILRIARWFAARAWRDQPSERGARLLDPIGDVAPKLIKRVHRKARRRSRHFARLDPKQRHKLRIALKDLRYVIDLLGSLFRKKDVRRAVKKLKALQGCLGHANDVRTASTLVDELRADGDRDSRVIERAGGTMLRRHERKLAGERRKTARRVRRFRRLDRFWKGS